MHAVDGRGTPIGFFVESAQKAEVKLAERTFAWLDNFRRLVGRWERLAQVYRAFFTLALVLIYLRQLLK